MSKIIEKFKSKFGIKKPEPWYKRTFKKAASIMDMKRRNKFITFFALLFVAVYFCMPSMESIVKKVVHKYGSEITGTNVTLGGLNISPTKGVASVKRVKIGNPKGYKSKNMFYLKELDAKLNISSLTDDTIIIESITIDNPEITYEMKTLTQSNITEILDNVKANTAKPASEPKKSAPAKKDKGEGKKVIIKTLTVTNGQIEAVVGAGSVKAPIKVALPTIQMKNIGQEKKGASVAETISTVLTKILQTASQTVVSANLSELKDASLNELKNVGDNLKQGADSLKNTGEHAAESIKNLGGLLKK
jgi:uncharacterized protein involved in outer membrane biogenesis